VKTEHSKDETFLINVAESIGSTLGAIAAKADAAQRVITGGAKREAKKVVGKTKRAARAVKKSGAARTTRSAARKVVKRAKRGAGRRTKTTRGRTRR
jgi:hypothetical protein